MTRFKVGDTVYRFDPNRRVYEKNEKGYSVGGPKFSEHFVPDRITGEDDREFHTERGMTINKRSGMLKWGRDTMTCYTEKEREDEIWSDSHRYKIRYALERIDAAALRKVAEVIGYKEDQ